MKNYAVECKSEAEVKELLTETKGVNNNGYIDYQFYWNRRGEGNESICFSINYKFKICGYSGREWYEDSECIIISLAELKELAEKELKVKAEREANKENIIKETISEKERETLLSEMHNLLEEYDYKCTDRALNKIIDTWAFNKADMIAAFKKHPHYLEGKFMIAFDTNIDRNIDVRGAKHFFNYYLNDVARWCKDDIPENLKKQREEEGCGLLPDKLFKLLLGDYGINTVTTKTLSSEMAEKINKVAPWAHAHEGQKTTRVVNKICTYLGYNKHPEYNREFAKYADAMSPMQIKRHTVLSLNPLDYLTMSFGNSWASCHTIDKSNKRGMPNSYEGQYSSGTVSYMLDETSSIFYTVDSNYEGNEYYTQPKINRQMFHWSRPCLVQGRLYPQDNDGCSEEYRVYREIAQKIFSELYGFPNFWHNTKGTDAASRYIYTEGTHYEDYTYYSNCNLSVIKGEEGNEKIFTVGHTPICIECGCEHDESGCINCCNIPNKFICNDCGDEINEEDVIWIDGEAYCRDCVDFCDCCEEYHRSESTWINDRHIYVCESCLEEYYSYCEFCNRYFDNDDMHYVDDDGYVCSDCFEEHFCECESCNTNVRRINAQRIGRYYYCDDCAEDVEEKTDEIA